MSYLITIKTQPDSDGETYTAIGNLDALIDAAYDAGALGVTVMVQL
ncbi:hypothetical protein [Glaciimonas sp. PCH181]|nr:hypothetical protein [Glaciimonas sp. PCH181]